MHTIIETPDFIADASRAGISAKEREEMVSTIAKDPECGDPIKGAGGARKVRFPGRGKGKSGGYRVIFFYSGDGVPVWLLNVFSKGEKIDLTQSERNTMARELKGLVADYKERVRDRVQSRKSHPR